MTIYEKIKYLREQQNMSQQELAEKVGFKTASAVNKIELGLRDINQSKIKAFAAALNVSPSYLLTDDENILEKNNLTSKQQELYNSIVQLDDDKIKLAIRILRSILDENEQ